MIRIVSILVAGAVVVSACSGGSEATAADAALSATAPAQPTSTVQPDPTATAEPSPTAAPAPTATPTPEPTCQSVDPGDSTYTLEGGGAVHDVRVFVPSNITQVATTPVVLNWHGFGSNATEQVVFTAYEALAEAEGFIVVHPTGLPFPDTDDNSWETGGFDDPTRDDLAFANTLIDDVVERFCGDPTRIYSTGMSNGGFFTSRLVCELADRIAAAVSVAGITHPDDCAPARAVPFMAFHGTADATVAFDGTGTDLTNQSMPGEFAQFAATMGCVTEPAETALGDDVIRYDYSGCDDDVPLSFFEITDGGHTWPSSPLAAVVEASLGRTTNTVNATEDGWAFLKEHRLGS